MRLTMLLCSILSIGCGAVVGPEASLGAAGTTLGTVIGRRWKLGTIKAESDDHCSASGGSMEDPKSAPVLSKFLPDFRNEAKSCGLDGLVASLGALMPSQYLSALLLFELGFNRLFGRGGLSIFAESLSNRKFFRWKVEGWNDP